MKKKNVGVIGCGKWGKKIIKELYPISNIKFIYNSKSNYKDIKENINWIFILTPDKSHYQIVKYFLKRKTNVFCEKPLATQLYQAKSLVNLSKRFKTKLYIDDIEIYKKKKIRLDKKNNRILRTKKDIGTSKSLLNRLAYHDLYLLGEYISVKNIKLIDAEAKNKILKFKIILKNKMIFDFFYSINSKIKQHFLNNTRMDKFRNNPIKDMLRSVLYKSNNFTKNNENALKCIMLIKKIEKKIK